MKLGDRMKHYERSVGNQLTLRCPAIVRLDGRAFSTLTRGLQKPFDKRFQTFMLATAVHLCEKISTANLAYIQSDEISILLIDYGRFETEQFFGGKVQKLVSVIASEATVAFNKALNEYLPREDSDSLPALFQATFDARVFSIPERDVVNYFVWRQKDCIRNSIQAKGQAHFSPRQLHGKSSDDITAMLRGLKWNCDIDVNPNWNDESRGNKFGFVCAKDLGYYSMDHPVNNPVNWLTENSLIFAEHRNFIEKRLQPKEEELSS